MKRHLSAFLLLLTVTRGQVILQTDFNDGWPVGWTSRFGFVQDGSLQFHNRSTTSDVFSPGRDLSGDGTFILTFDLRTNAASNHSLLVGLAPSGGSTQWIAASLTAATAKGLATILTGTPDSSSQMIDLTPYLSAYSASERYGMRIALSTWLNGAVSSDAVFVDNFKLVDPPASAISEPSCISCLAGLVALILALVLKRKKSCHA